MLKETGETAEYWHSQRARDWEIAVVPRERVVVTSFTIYYV